MSKPTTPRKFAEAPTVNEWIEALKEADEYQREEGWLILSEIISLVKESGVTNISTTRTAMRNRLTKAVENGTLKSKSVFIRHPDSGAVTKSTVYKISNLNPKEL